MKKNFIYALMSAIALTGAMSFASCAENEDLSDNPGYNPETGEVPVDFVFNVSTGNTPTTRMSDANTQATLSQTFRGIDNVQLLSFKLGTTNDGKHVATAQTADKIFGLGTILTPGELKPASTVAADTKSRRVIELALPTESNAMMFWGKAIKDGTDFQEGKVDFSVQQNLANSAFSLIRIVPEESESDFQQYQKLIAAVLTKIVQSSVSSTTDITYGTPTQTHSGGMKWSDYATVSSSSTGVITSIVAKTSDPASPDQENPLAMCPKGEILADAFVKMNKVYPDELRAGSASDVARMIGDLYNAINSVASTDATSLQDAVAKNVGAQIIHNINQAFKNVESNCAWDTETSTTLAAVKEFAGESSNTAGTKLHEFPTNFNLPLGSVILNIFQNPTSHEIEYSYSGSIPTYAMGGSSSSTETNFNPMNYVYPAELCYFGNSAVRVTDDPHDTDDYPDGTSNWDNPDKWAANAMGEGSKAWTTTHVLSTTRSVAMKDNINYGTALLKTTVAYGSTELEDNNYYIQNQRTGATEQNAKFNVGANNGLFTLTGILIGGQEKTMGWNYVAKAGDEATFAYMVYDKDIPSTAIPTTASPCYTLLWDNWDESKKGDKQRDVYVALEFKNNSNRDFWGEQNLIRNGGTFYITGKLDPDNPGGTALSTVDRSDGISWPTNYALPPYDNNGSTIQERRVFIQDYMTTANFVLNRYSLQHALVSVPDLRSSQISLGLSVNLEWTTGIDFGDVILGGDNTGHNPPSGD